MIWVIYAIVVIAVLAVLLFSARRKAEETKPTSYDLPSVIEVGDINDTATVHVLMFSSTSCEGCSGVWDKAKVLESKEVEVLNISYQDEQGKKLHEKYQIEAVPSLLITDKQGNTLKAFMGSVTATDLWAAVAEARGAQIESCSSH